MADLLITHGELPPDPSSSCYDLLLPDCDVQLQSGNFSNLQKPDMSEIRVILLGNSQSERTKLMNFILEVPVFNSEEEPDFLPVRGLLNDTEIVLVNTPDLLQPNISDHELAELTENCARLCDPGPHVLLLVLQPEDFTKEDSLRLRRVLKLFGDRPFDHSLVLISPPRKMGSRLLKFRLHPPMKDMIKASGYRVLWRKNLEHPQLFARLVQILKENNGKHVIRHESPYP